MQSLRSRHAYSLWLIIFMAVCTSMFRVSFVLANTLVLWRVYGRERVLREHLRITTIRPELVVSNGDALQGLAFQHYLIGAGSWLVSSFLVTLLIYRFLLPSGVQRLLKQSQTNTPDTVGVIGALGLFVLVAALLPLSAALTLALLSLLFALSWVRRIGVET